MKIHFMTLDGKVDREAFIEEWAHSQERDAVFLQTEKSVYLMPYGTYTPELPKDVLQVKFSGPYRRHTFVKRDFEITERILGGGYLKLAEDKASCSYNGKSSDFGMVESPGAVVIVVDELILGKKES